MHQFDANDVVVIQSGRVPDRSQLWRFTMKELKSNSPKKSARKQMNDLIHRSIKLTARGAAQTSTRSAAAAAAAAASSIPELPNIAAKSTRMLYNRTSPPPAKEETDEIDQLNPQEMSDGKAIHSINYYCIYFYINPCLNSFCGNFVDTIAPYILFPEAHPDVELNMSVASTFVHEGLEISCAQVNVVSINNMPEEEILETVTQKEEDNEFLNLLAANQSPSEKAEQDAKSTDQNNKSGGTSDLTSQIDANPASKVISGVIIPTIATGALDPKASVAFAADTNSVVDVNKDNKVAVLGVYLGTAQGTILRYEVELTVTVHPDAAITVRT